MTISIPRPLLIALVVVIVGIAGYLIGRTTSEDEAPTRSNAECLAAAEALADEVVTPPGAAPDLSDVRRRERLRDQAAALC